MHKYICTYCQAALWVESWGGGVDPGPDGTPWYYPTCPGCGGAMTWLGWFAVSVREEYR